MTQLPPEPNGNDLPGVIMAPGVDESVYSIANLLDLILRGVIDGFENAGVSLPERRYWTIGTPPVDCAQLVVSFRQAYYGPPGDEASEPQRCDGPRSAAIEVRISRKIPVPKGTRASAPKAAAIQLSAQEQLVDAWLLLDFVPNLDFWNGPMMPAGLGVIGTVDGGEAQGDYQTTVLNLTVGIP